MGESFFRCVRPHILCSELIRIQNTNKYFWYYVKTDDYVNIHQCYHFMLIQYVVLLTLYGLRVAKFVVKTERNSVLPTGF